MLAHGSGDFFLTAFLAELESALRRAQRRFPEALALLSHAGAFYRETGDPEALARLQFRMARLRYEAGDGVRATQACLASASSGYGAGVPERTAGLLHNLSIFLDSAGWGALGARILKQTRWLRQAVGDEPFRLRGLWLEGRLQRGAGELVRAAGCFEEARQGFLALDMGYDAALVSLELALIYAETGLAFDLAQLAGEMVPVFTALDVPREAAAAVLLFAESARQQRATAAQIHAALAQLDPKSRVEPVAPA